MVRDLALACWLLWIAAGCATSPHVVVPTDGGVQRVEVAALLAAHPLPAEQNILAVSLGHTEALSLHLVQIRDREPPHVHATHDLVVTVLRGTGTLYVRGQPHDMRAGDVASVPRGTPHYFVNRESTPAAAFVTFAPPFDGKDQVPAE